MSSVADTLKLYRLVEYCRLYDSDAPALFSLSLLHVTVISAANIVEKMSLAERSAYISVALNDAREEGKMINHPYSLNDRLYMAVKIVGKLITTMHEQDRVYLNRILRKILDEYAENDSARFQKQLASFKKVIKNLSLYPSHYAPGCSSHSRHSRSPSLVAIALIAIATLNPSHSPNRHSHP